AFLPWGAHPSPEVCGISFPAGENSVFRPCSMPLSKTVIITGINITHPFAHCKQFSKKSKNFYQTFFPMGTHTKSGEEAERSCTKKRRFLRRKLT
ncbi:MAG: hypothetical protein RR606_07605, partial [Oscillospiraceae bacterium]